MIDKFVWSDPLSEDQAEGMQSRTLFGDVWLEGDRLAYMMYAYIAPDDTITLSIKAIAERELDQVITDLEYITTKKGNNTDFLVFSQPKDADEIREAFAAAGE